MGRKFVVCALVVAGCGARPPVSELALKRVTLYQNGIGYFEREGQVSGEQIELEFSRHEVDDVLKTLTVLDKVGGGVTTVDLPALKDEDARVRVGVRLSGGKGHAVAVSYAVPTPTWKAAYRVVVDDKDYTGGGLLQGWAAIVNASQEDWTDVKLSLATGAPMSYALDLHSPEYVKRPDANGNMVAPAVWAPIKTEVVGAAGSDQDSDNIANESDLCPAAAEDLDGFEDGDGCPDPDNDQDRTADADDRCPNEPETYNGVDDEDGCPDRGRVIVTDASIEILDTVYFKKGSDAVQPPSYPILDAVVATLMGNPEIKLLEVQGHAAKGEKAAFEVSQRRAQAVKTYLVGKGLGAERLVTASYGDSQLIDQDKGEKANAKNRRVAFLILKRGDGASSQPVVTIVDKPRTIDVSSMAASARTSTTPTEVAGAVRYDLGVPVTIRKGTATMVSIINKPVTAEDAFLFRPDSNAPGTDVHPFRAVRLVNTSGFTLQPGPVAIFARGTFVGDSLLDRLDVDETAWVPYAIDSGTRVTHTADDDEQPVRIASIVRGTATVESAGVRTTTYTIQAGRQPAKRIFIRHEKSYRYTAQDLPPGSVDQGASWLVPLPLTAGKTSTLTIEERQTRRTSLSIVNADYKTLELYVQGSKLPADVAAKLPEILRLRKDVGAIEASLEQLRSRFQDVSDRSYEIRANLESLRNVKGSDELKKKLTASLAQAAQDSDATAKEIAAKSDELTKLTARLEDLIREVHVEEPKP